TDDLNLPFGTIRIKPKGSDGGHNGLKDIQTRLGTVGYPRFRFGIGNTFEQGRQVDFVLGRWSAEELSTLDERLERSVAAIQSFVFAGLPQTMNTYNNS
ncbi:MAG: aminoacyl-tRNA hydrolase, partial [Bacteroidetes bacterium]|nr:aminoacyl-tRNA hydrolase [Bacteroidota bacterium]